MVRRIIPHSCRKSKFLSAEMRILAAKRHQGGDVEGGPPTVDLIVIWGLTIFCGCDILYLHLEDSMQLREKRACFVVDSPVGKGDSLLGFFNGKM